MHLEELVVMMVKVISSINMLVAYSSCFEMIKLFIRFGWFLCISVSYTFFDF